jgi:hypothetical protein
MKRLLLLIICLLIGGCSSEMVEELAFRKVMEYQLKDECRDEDKACIAAVEAQIESCMIQSDWRQFLENEEDEEEVQRFVSEFLPCFKDSEGSAYFTSA